MQLTGVKLREGVSLICHQRQVIYIHPCRCAGSSIEALFGFGSDQLNRTGDRHALPDFYPKRYWRQYASFISVRNPWERLLSAFSLIKQLDLPGYKAVMDSYDLSSFNDFVAEVMTQPELYRDDRMFWPQYRWFYYGKRRVKFDFTIRFENFRRDIAPLLDKSGKPGKEIPHLLSTDKPHYREVYNRQSFEIVRDIYKKDIELLHYRF